MKTAMQIVTSTVFGLALASSASATTVRIHYGAADDAGQANMGVVGDKGPLSWTSSASATRSASGVWTYTWPDRLGDIAMKPALGDRIASGGTYRLKAGSTVDVFPFFGKPAGKVTMVADFASPQLGNKRQLRIYLPPSYEENRVKRYPVLYMHDGQNLFDAKTAAYGTEWGIDETMDRLIAGGAIEEVIVVGIDNTPDRIAEYTPCCDPKLGGGKLDAYQAFIIDTLKPYIDQTLRTLPGRETTAIMGSSLGGIASVVIGQRKPDVFSRAGGVSSSFWWNEKALALKPAPRVPVKFYLDAGTVDDGLDDSALMRDAMLKQGYRTGEDLLFFAHEGGKHNEASWAARVDKPLTWFFPFGGVQQQR